MVEYVSVDYDSWGGFNSLTEVSKFTGYTTSNLSCPIEQFCGFMPKESTSEKDQEGGGGGVCMRNSSR